MPSKSPAQARLMAAAAHTPGGYGGVPQSVGKEFNQADTGTGMIHPKHMMRQRAMAAAVRAHKPKAQKDSDGDGDGAY